MQAVTPKAPLGHRAHLCHAVIAPLAAAGAAHPVLGVSNPAIGQQHVIPSGDHRVDLKILTDNLTIAPDTAHGSYDATINTFTARHMSSSA